MMVVLDPEFDPLVHAALRESTIQPVTLQTMHSCLCNRLRMLLTNRLLVEVISLANTAYFADMNWLCEYAEMELRRRCQRRMLFYWWVYPMLLPSLCGAFTTDCASSAQAEEYISRDDDGKCQRGQGKARPGELLEQGVQAGIVEDHVGRRPRQY